MFNVKIITNNKINAFVLNKIIFTVFFIRECLYLVNGGTTYDTFELWNGSNRIYSKLVLLKNFQLDSSLLNDLNVYDFFGYVFLFPAFLLERFINKNLFDINNQSLFEISNFFISENGMTFFVLQFSLLLYSFLILIIINKKIIKIESVQVSNYFLIILFLIPSFSGHLIFNLKDIPFALNLFLASIYVYDFFDDVKANKTLKSFFVTAFFIAISMSVRLSAILFFLFLFCFIALKNKFNLKVLNSISKLFFVSIILLIVLTPQSWINPFNWLQATFEFQTQHQWGSWTLTNGKYISAQDVSNDYLITWFIFRTPIVLSALFLVSVYFLIKNKKINFSFYCFIFVLANFLLFPFINPTAYDGLRHYLYLYLFISFITASSIGQLKFKNKVAKQLILTLLTIHLLYTQFGLEQYRYTYLNEFADEENISYFCENSIDGCGDWITDYWGFSGMETAKYANNNLSNEKILVCSPGHSFDTYIKLGQLNFDYLYVEEIINEKDVYVFTLHRPRYKNDSCGFLKYNINFECDLIYQNSRQLRGKEMALSYISKCNLDSN